MNLKIAWRRLRGRCHACGKRREQHAHACYHCADPALCHRCGKTRNYGRIFGAGLPALRKAAGQ